MADKGLKYVGENPIKGMALGSQEGHKLYLGGTLIWEDPIIEFDDDAVKAICVANWGDSIYDDDITEWEASKATSLAGKFRGNTNIITFNELKYFVGLTSFGVLNGNGEFQGCNKLTNVTIPKISTTSIDLTGLFRGCSKLTSVDLSPINTQSITAIQHIFRGNSVITKITMPSGNYGGAANYAFASCANLVTLNVGTADWSGITSFGSGSSGMFYNCPKLESITGTIIGIRQNITLGNCSALTRDSLLIVINGLADLTGTTGKTLTLHATAKARLTSEDMAIAQNKNWQIA